MKYRKVQGFTLVEVMIALFVLSVGLLGSTAMIHNGRAIAKNTNYDSMASQMASSVAEMMRSNITGVAEGSYNALNSHVANPGCIVTGCTADNMAKYDSYIWGWMLDQYLPGATGTIRGTGLDSVFTITISWTEVRREAANTGSEITQTYTMMFQP